MSVGLEVVDVEELRNRLKTIMDDADCLLKKIGPDVMTIGKLRTEIAMITSELEKRDAKKNDA